jgi:hypothetical protein
MDEVLQPEYANGHNVVPGVIVGSVTTLGESIKRLTVAMESNPEHVDLPAHSRLLDGAASRLLTTSSMIEHRTRRRGRNGEKVPDEVTPEMAVKHSVGYKAITAVGVANLHSRFVQADDDETSYLVLVVPLSFLHHTRQSFAPRLAQRGPKRHRLPKSKTSRFSHWLRWMVLMYDCLRVARRITSDLLFDLLRRCKMKSIPTWIPSSDRVQRCRGKCVYHYCPFLAAAQTVGFWARL